MSLSPSGGRTRISPMTLFSRVGRFFPKSASCFQGRPAVSRVGQLFPESAVFGTSRPFLERVRRFWNGSVQFGTSRPLLERVARRGGLAAGRRCRATTWPANLPFWRRTCPAEDETCGRSGVPDRPVLDVPNRPALGRKLARDVRIGDLGVVGQQKGLAEDHRERRVSLEREMHAFATGDCLPGHDAQVLIVR